MAIQQQGLGVPRNTRQQQMKRELMGLVLGSVFLLAGVAFLFTRTSDLANPGASARPLAQSADDEAGISHEAVAVAPAGGGTVSVGTAAALPIVMASAPAATLSQPAVSSQDSAPAITSTAGSSVAAEPVVPAAGATPGSSDPATAQADPAAVTETEPVADSTADAAQQAFGWIYAGQFVGGKWLEKGLNIGNELPVSGQRYPLNWGATVRAAPPGKNSGGKQSNSRGYLAQGQSIQVLQVRPSGSKGHIWLEIAR